MSIVFLPVQRLFDMDYWQRFARDAVNADLLCNIRLSLAITFSVCRLSKLMNEYPIEMGTAVYVFLEPNKLQWLWTLVCWWSEFDELYRCCLSYNIVQDLAANRLISGSFLAILCFGYQDWKTEWYLRCLLAKATWWIKCKYNYNHFAIKLLYFLCWVFNAEFLLRLDIATYLIIQNYLHSNCS